MHDLGTVKQSPRFSRIKAMLNLRMNHHDPTNLIRSASRRRPAIERQLDQKKREPLPTLSVEQLAIVVGRNMPK